MSRRFLLLHKKNASKRRIEEREDIVLKFPDGTYNGRYLSVEKYGIRQRHGHGIMKYKNGREYVGEWKGDKREGKGTLQCSSGDRYEGQFQNDKMDGRGVYKCSNGNSYVGDWKEGKRHGLGTYRYTNGNVFEGSWKDGFKHGPGIFTYSDGHKRINIFEYGNIAHNNDCLMFNSNGSRAWKMVEISIEDANTLSEKIGMPNSMKEKFSVNELLVIDESIDEIEEIRSCVEVTEDGIIEDNVDAGTSDPSPKSQSNNIANIMKIKKVYQDGEYEGQINYSDQREGIGTMVCNNKKKYEGQWKADKKHGKGTLVSPSGKLYNGEFINDLKEGYGIMNYPSGAIYEGYWKHGKMHGTGKYKYDSGIIDYCYFIEGRASGVGLRWKSNLTKVYRTLNDKIVCETSFDKAKVLMEEMGFPT